MKQAIKLGEKIEIFNPGWWKVKVDEHYSGKVCIEGSYYPQPHKWYAELTVENGKIVRVK